MMKTTLKYLSMVALLGMVITFTACDDDDDNDMPINIVYEQEDQMARPAINTVFVSEGEKDIFNTTTPAQQGAAFATKFNDKLLALNPGYTTNLLGLDAATFTGVLATDVMTVSLTAPTTFYDGTNVLTGRKLDDDVITVELILLFGGPDAMSNPGLTDDHVDANDKAFSGTFPYLASPH
jgi:Domain of unknown function (DUF4331)